MALQAYQTVPPAQFSPLPANFKIATIKKTAVKKGHETPVEVGYTRTGILDMEQLVKGYKIDLRDGQGGNLLQSTGLKNAVNLGGGNYLLETRTSYYLITILA